MQTNFCIIKHGVKKKENSLRECTTPKNPYPFNLIAKVCKFVLDWDYYNIAKISNVYVRFMIGGILIP